MVCWIDKTTKLCRFLTFRTTLLSRGYVCHEFCIIDRTCIDKTLEGFISWRNAMYLQLEYLYCHFYLISKQSENDKFEVPFTQTWVRNGNYDVCLASNPTVTWDISIQMGLFVTSTVCQIKYTLGCVLLCCGSYIISCKIVQSIYR